jgi:hypothetical protein
MDNEAEMETSVDVKLMCAILLCADVVHDIIAQGVFYNERDQARSGRYDTTHTAHFYAGY